MSSARKMAKVFWLVGDIDTKLATKFIDYIYECAVDESEAICVIASQGGDILAIQNIISTLKSTGVKLITVGFGNVDSVASAIFFLGDERYLATGTKISIFSENNVFDDIYLGKTNIPEEVYYEETSGLEAWEIPCEKYDNYEFTTGSYEEVVAMLVENYRNNLSKRKVVVPLKFNGIMDLQSTKSVLQYFLTCAASSREAYVEIDSSGGDMACLDAIISTLDATGIKLTTIGGGDVSSCAAALFLMGDRRALKENANLLLHEVRMIVIQGGKFFAHEFFAMAEGLKQSTERYVSYCAKKTTLSKEEFYKRTKKGRDWVVNLAEDNFSFLTHSYEEILKEIITLRRK